METTNKKKNKTIAKIAICNKNNTGAENEIRLGVNLTLSSNINS